MREASGRGARLSGPMMLMGVTVILIGLMLFSAGVFVARASFPGIVPEDPADRHLPATWPIGAALQVAGVAAFVGGLVACIQAVRLPRRALAEQARQPDSAPGEVG